MMYNFRALNQMLSFGIFIVKNLLFTTLKLFQVANYFIEAEFLIHFFAGILWEYAV